MHSTQAVISSSRPARPRVRRVVPLAMRLTTHLAGVPVVAAALGVALGVALMGAGCTHKAGTPPGTGPSELGLSLGLAASPDVLDIDGLSQSRIAITARGPDAAPVANITLNLDIMVGNQVLDVGRLSSKTVTTGSDGVARVTYTAPAGAPTGNSDALFTINIRAIPLGTDYSNAVSRSVDIRLRPRGVIIPEAHSPVPRFTMSPTDAGTDQDIQFDASSSIPSCLPDPTDPNNADKCTPEAGEIVSYLWDFGNRRTGSGVRASTFYSSAGIFTVKLTVTNSRGLTNFVTQEVSITEIAGPSAAFTVSPTTVGVNERVNVDASASQPTADRSLVEYNWTWGDGGRSSGVLQNHRYAQAGSYTIALTVVDSTGRTGTTTQSVTVGAGQLPTASFTVSPTTAVAGDNVFFDASQSTAPPGRTIANYEWNFGDGSQVLSGPNEGRPRHVFTRAGTFVVTLTVSDSATAKSAAVTRNVTVQ